MSWYLEVLKKYAVFSGRARRMEYWMFFLINMIVSFALGFIEGLFGGPGILATIYYVAVLVPSIAVGVRRLHDIERSGWWLLISLVPLIGVIVLIVFLASPGRPGSNKYGADPKSAA